MLIGVLSFKILFFICRILRLQEVGVMDYIKRAYLKKFKTPSEVSTFTSIGIEMLALPLVILITGYLLSIFFIILELCTF